MAADPIISTGNLRRIIHPMRWLACLAVFFMLAVWGCKESEQQQSAADSDASRPGSGQAREKTVLAMKRDGPPIEVRQFEDPDNPYRGKYSALDQWVWNNFDPGEENPARWPKQMPSGMTQRALIVDDGGYAMPGLVYAQFELEQRSQGLPASRRPGTSILYALGTLSDELHFSSLEQRYRLIASYMPPIPEWLALAPPKWAIRLPDSTFVTLGELGSGDGYFPESGSVRNLRETPACHYSARGELLAVGKAGSLWCELFFSGFEELLESSGVDRSNVTTTGWFVTLRDFQSRDPQVYYYDGTPVSAEQVAQLPELNNLFEMYGRYIPAMYAEQQTTPARETGNE